MYPHEKLNGAMAEKGLKGDDVAREAGLSPTTVSFIRNGKENIKLSSLKAFPGAVGLKVEITFTPKAEVSELEAARS